MFTCDFSKRGNLPLWEFLYTEIKNAVISGLFSPDEKMPSKRTLASHLGISVITVAAAYNQLISEGWLYSIERRGFFVTNIRESVPEKTFRASRAEKIPAAGKIPERPETGNTAQKEKWFADFRDNSTALEKFPFSQWSKIIRKILHMPDSKVLSRCETAGLKELREEISSYLLRFRNIKASPERIIICPGTEYAYGMLVQILGRERIYAVENPGYRKTADVLRINGAVCCPVDMDKEGIRPDIIEKLNVSVIHVSPLHHYPTGRVMPVKRRMELLSWSMKNDGEDDAAKDRWIIEDDYDSEFRFTGKPLETLQSLSESSGRNRVIYINTFSKTLAPSFRISYIVLPETLLEDFSEKAGFFACAVPNLDQMALAEFMKNRNFETHILRMKNYYRTTRNNLITAIESGKLADISHIKEEDAGLHFLLTLDTDISGEKLKGKLAEEGINAALLSDYFHGKESAADFPEAADKTLVINYSGISRERIPAAVKRMEKALTPVR